MAIRPRGEFRPARKIQLFKAWGACNLQLPPFEMEAASPDEKGGPFDLNGMRTMGGDQRMPPFLNFPKAVNILNSKYSCAFNFGMFLAGRKGASEMSEIAMRNAIDF